VLVGGIDGAVNGPGIEAQLDEPQNRSEHFLVFVESLDGGPNEKPVQEKGHKAVFVALTVNVPKSRHNR